jgi:uncharacterized membrane protein
VSLVLVHIVAGFSAVMAGVFALFVTKGGALHRTAGSVFVWSMVVMGTLGAIMAASRLHLPVQKINIVAGLFAAYLVTTSLLTVRPLNRRWIHVLAACIAFGVAAFAFAVAIAGLAQPKPSWFPAVPATIFASIALAAAVGDVRMIRTGALRGSRRIARHLWRMCVAMFIAVMSFSVQQGKVLPAGLHGGTVLAILSLTVLAVMAWYLVRLRRGDGKRHVESTGAPMAHLTA